MTPEKKKKQRQDVFTAIAVIAILLLTRRSWPILLLLLIGLVFYALWMLFRIQKQPEREEPRPLPEPTVQASEMTLRIAAFGLLQQRISEYVAVQFPNARWAWSVSNAFDRFQAGLPLTILLNGAGGRQRASVLVQSLQFMGLEYDPVPQARPQSRTPDRREEAPRDQTETDYGLLAFEWVEANLERINAQSCEAAAAGRQSFHIPAEELPHGDGWSEICAELVRNGLASAKPQADGIHVKIKTEE